MPPRLRIAGLPDELAHVPSWRDGEDYGYADEIAGWAGFITTHGSIDAKGTYPKPGTLPAWWDGIPTDWRGAWRRWRCAVGVFRTVVAIQTALHPKLRADQLALCRQDPTRSYFLNVFAWVHEPRGGVDPDFPKPGWKPWISLPHQVWLQDEIVAAMDDDDGPGGDMLVEKSRTMAATWSFCGWFAGEWLFADSFVAALMSYKEEIVSNGTPKSMFYKVRAVLGLVNSAPGLPTWMFPDKFNLDARNLDRTLSLSHPSKTNVIGGEATTSNTGRADRVTARLNDEAAQFPKLSTILTAQRATTNHIFNVSTANLAYGDDFDKLARVAKAGKGPRYVRLLWDMHPFYTADWYEKEKAKYAHDPEGFAREVDIDPYAGFGKFIYRKKTEGRPHGDGVPGFDPTRQTYVSIDPGGTDDWAIEVAQVILRPDRPDAPDVIVVDSISRNLEGASYYAHLLTGIKPRRGDPHWGKFDDRRSTLFMQTMASLPWKGDYIWWLGDPSGKSRGGGSFTSTYHALFTESLALRRRWLEERREAGATNLPNRPVGINALEDDLFKEREFDKRRQHTKEVLEYTQFAPTEGALEVRDALMQARFTELTLNATTGPKHVHGEESHLVSAFEFLAAYLRLRKFFKGVARREALRDHEEEAIWLPPNGVAA